MRIPLFRVDAFASGPLTGNPAAVCPVDSWLDDGLLLKVARENNLSETAFFVPREAGYELRWFTPRCEVKLCGHATLAAAYVILNLLQLGLAKVRFETRFAGRLDVGRDGDLLSMDFPVTLTEACAEPPVELIRGLRQGTLPSHVLKGDETYVAVYDAEDTIRKMRPDFTRLEQLHPFAVSVTAPGEASDFVSRYFAPSYGIPEDPVTGSAHCLLAPYWADRLGKTLLHARQVSERGGELWCEVAGERVILKGKARLAGEGSLVI